MTANQFAEMYRFTDNDKSVVNKMFGSQEKEETEWFDELSSDFTFSKKDFILKNKAKKETVEVSEEIKTKKTKNKWQQ